MLTPKLAIAFACTLLCTTAIAQQKGTFTDTRDGKVYKTIKIGTQTWMAENLNFNANGSKCYKNKTENCDKYGRLYNWNMAKTACPKNWHLPSKAEWDVLMAAVGGEKTAGKYLRDTSGFFALPGGYGASGGFYNVGNYGYWWSSTAYNSYEIYLLIIYYNNEDTYWGLGNNYLRSVRCLEGLTNF